MTSIFDSLPCMTLGDLSAYVYHMYVCIYVYVYSDLSAYVYQHGGGRPGQGRESVRTYTCAWIVARARTRVFLVVVVFVREWMCVCVYVYTCGNVCGVCVCVMTLCVCVYMHGWIRRLSICLSVRLSACLRIYTYVYTGME